MFYRLQYLFSLVLLTTSLWGQPNNIGIPFTISYPNEIYQAGTQNWDIDQHPNGFMFFANNNGLLQYDGINWQLFPLKNKTIARSLHITQAGRIYVGGQGEFGFFEPDDNGLLIFHSLVDLIPEPHNNFADVWRLIEVNGEIYFNASSKVFVYNGQTIDVIRDGTIDYLGTAQDRVFINNENGVGEIVDNQVLALQGGAQLTGNIITSVIAHEDESILFCTLDNGIFTYNNQETSVYQKDGLDFFSANKISCSDNLALGKIVIGTPNAGVVIIENNGQFLYKLDRNNGLQNNHVLSVFTDRTNNIWLGLNNGIDYIAHDAPFSKLTPDNEQESTAYGAKIHDGQLYLGTSNGLYRQPWQTYYNPLKDNNFELIKGSEGQVWGIDQLKTDLFIGHHEGAFIINNQQRTKIATTLGNWTILPLTKHPNYYLIGTYEGLHLYKKEKETWLKIREYEGLEESCRIMEEDDFGNVWISHPYRGVYKVQVADDLTTIKVQLYGATDGLPSNNLNHVFKINEEIVFTGETGVFKYAVENDAFTPYIEMVNLIGPAESIQRFFEDRVGNIWFTTTNQTGLLKIDDKGITKSFSKVVYPELSNKLVRGFELIYPFDEHHVFIGAEKGYIHFNPSKKLANQQKDFTASIVKVQTIRKDSILIFGQFNAKQQELSTPLSYEDNALRFSFVSTNFAFKEDLQFATKLEGFDDAWSNWSAKPEKDFTNLNSGDYRFLVKAKSMHGQESKIASFSFVIKPPWYASYQAKIIYFLLGLMILSGLILIPRKKFQEERAQLQSAQKRKDVAHLKAVEQSEKEIVSLKNQQLEIEIAHKNSELAMSTMHLVQRSELIQQIQATLDKVIKNTNDSKAAGDLKRVNRLLNENAQLDDTWNQFAHHFDQVHNDFLQKIKEAHPQLTANDQKLCAYLKMNLSTKEMAPLMNISIRGVEVARYRLRKKLGLDSSVNLNEFMLNF